MAHFSAGSRSIFSLGRPTATDAVKQIARIVYSERKLQAARPPERVRPDRVGAMATGAAVNMLVHRDYEVERSANIDIQPGIQIAFKNPGGLTPKMTTLVSVDSDGKIGIAARATDPRNVSLCDIFFGLRAMERAGTGLIDVNWKN